MQAALLPLVHDFLLSERLKLRRWLLDRVRCELDLAEEEAEAALLRLEGEGLLRTVEISHYDSALEDVTVELAVAPGAALAATSAG